ncbi:hypothetical protein K9M09_00435 [Patescibacteria group bacterium]|nr:hypothetical protein [Patescibacteria group bacterium]
MAYSFIYSRWYALKRRLSFILTKYWRYQPNRLYLLISVIMQVLIWIFAYQIYISLGNDLLVAHYNVDFGIDAIGNPKQIFNIPLLALGALILNGFVLSFFTKRLNFNFLTNAAGITGVMVQLLAALALMSLYLINFLA